MISTKSQLQSYGELVSRAEGIRVAGERADTVAEPIHEILEAMKSLLSDSIEVLQEKQLSASQVYRSLSLNRDGGADVPEISTDKSTPSELLRELEVMRMRMVGVLVMGSRDPSIILMQNLPDIQSTLVTTASGITYGLVAGYCVCLLPSFEDPQHEALFGEGMLELFEATSNSRGIILDCSAVRSLPIMVQAVILGYKHTFFIKGRDFSVVWLHAGAVKGTSGSALANAFNGERIGEYIFSRRE
jgi:hypothetical protein